MSFEIYKVLLCFYDCKMSHVYSSHWSLQILRWTPVFFTWLHQTSAQWKQQRLYTWAQWHSALLQVRIICDSRRLIELTAEIANIATRNYFRWWHGVIAHRIKYRCYGMLSGSSTTMFSFCYRKPLTIDSYGGENFQLCNFVQVAFVNVCRNPTVYGEYILWEQISRQDKSTQPTGR